MSFDLLTEGDGSADVVSSGWSFQVCGLTMKSLANGATEIWSFVVVVVDVVV